MGYESSHKSHSLGAPRHPSPPPRPSVAVTSSGPPPGGQGKARSQISHWAQITNGPPPRRSAGIPFQERRAKLNKVLRPGRFRLRGGATTSRPSSSACRFIAAQKEAGDRQMESINFNGQLIHRGTAGQASRETPLDLTWFFVASSLDCVIICLTSGSFHRSSRCTLAR